MFGFKLGAVRHALALRVSFPLCLQTLGRSSIVYYEPKVRSGPKVGRLQVFDVNREQHIKQGAQVLTNN